MRIKNGKIIYLAHQSEALRENPLGDPFERELPVYLPPVYEDGEHFPVIWVLAPFTSWGARFFNLQAWDENIAQIADRLMASGDCPPAILAFPDCFTRFGGSQYINSSAVGNYQDYLLNELVPFLDAECRTRPERKFRGILGYSSGGFAAMRYSMLHNDLFSVAASHSGDIGFLNAFLPDVALAVTTLEHYGGVAAFIKSIGALREPGREWFSTLNLIALSACYSPNPHSPDGFDLPFDRYTGSLLPAIWSRWLSFDPVEMVGQHLDSLKKMSLFYFDCGNRDEYNLHLGSRRLHVLLKENGVSHQYEEFQGGHRGINWRYAISLPFIARTLADQAL